MKATLKYQFSKLLDSAYLVLAMALIFLISSIILGNGSPLDRAVSGLSMVNILFMIMPFSVFMSFYSTFFNLSLGFGSTRKNYAIGVWIMNIIFSAILSLSLVLFYFILNYIFNLNLTIDYRIFVLEFFSALFFGSIGEISGILTTLLGRWFSVVCGVFLGLLCGGLGAFVGFNVATSETGASSTEVTGFILDIVNGLQSVNVLIILTTLSIILSIASLLISRKINYR